MDMSTKLLTGILLVATAAFAATGSRRTAAALANDSSLIVLSEVTAIRAIDHTIMMAGQERIPVDLMRATVRVSAIIKGQNPGNFLNVTFARPRVPLGYRGLKTGEYQMLFLRNGKDGWTIVDDNTPSYPAMRGTTISGSTTLERIAAVLEDVAGNSTAATSDRVFTLEVLTEMDVPDLGGVEQLTTESDVPTDVKLVAAAVAIRHQNCEIIDRVPALLRGVTNERVRFDLAAAIAIGPRDIKCATQLSPLLRSSYVEIRRATAKALRHIASQEVIPELIMALDDTDREVRYQASLGLGVITAQSEWSPPMGEYIQNESHYLTHWKEWAHTWKESQNR
jgi:hypothetical protein